MTRRGFLSALIAGAAAGARMPYPRTRLTLTLTRNPVPQFLQRQIIKARSQGTLKAIVRYGNPGPEYTATFNRALADFNRRRARAI